MHSTVFESSRLELQNATNFIKKYLFALDLSEPKFYKPKNVLNWWKTSSKTPTANFWNSKSFKNLRFCSNFFIFFSKSFRLPNWFSEWIPYRMPMHSTVLESSRRRIFGTRKVSKILRFCSNFFIFFRKVFDFQIDFRNESLIACQCTAPF